MMKRYRGYKDRCYKMFWPTIFVLIILLAMLAAILFIRITEEKIITIEYEEPDITDNGIYDPIPETPSSWTLETHIPDGTPPSTHEPTPEPIEESEVIYFDEYDQLILAKIMHAEAYITYAISGSPYEMACVGWCVLNRVDNTSQDFVRWNTIEEVITAPHQFASIKGVEVTQWELDLALDILKRWNTEKNTGECEGRVLPAEYLFFRGDGKHNYFRTTYEGDGTYYTYWMDSPYVHWLS